MKKIITLLLILAGLTGAAVIYQKNQKTRLSTAASLGTKTRERLLTDLDILAVKKLRIRNDKSEVNITISDDHKSAKVLERSGYAASLDRINSALSQLYDQRIASKQEVGKTAWSEIDVQPPGENLSGVGTQIELIGDGGKILKSMILGKQISTTGGRSSTQFDGGSQRFVRIPEDGNTIWVVSNTFFELEPTPDVWLDKAFLDVQKIKEVTVTHPQPEESWKVSRPDELTPDYVLADAKVGEAIDGAKLSLSALLSTPVFNDVVPKDKAAEVLKDPIKAKIVTFDGFTYDFQFVKQSKDGADRYYVAVKVSADLPKTRPEVKDEKEEDKKKADEAFANRKKTLEEKLAKEQKLNDWVFEVSEYTVNNFFKKRSEIVQVSAKASPAPGSPEGNGLSIPGAPTPAAPARTPIPAPQASAPAAPEAASPLEAKPPVVSSPPIQVPAPAAPEIKPEAAPDTTPVDPKP